MKLTPLYSNLLVRPILKGDLTKGGLVIPAIYAKNAPFRYADVIAVGTGRVNAEGKTVPLVCKAGDVVAYAKGAGIEIPIETEDGKEELLTLLEERYVLGIVHDLKRPSAIIGLDGHLLDMEPRSHAKPDVAYKNIDELAKAERDWPELVGNDNGHDEPEPETMD